MHYRELLATHQDSIPDAGSTEIRRRRWSGSTACRIAQGQAEATSPRFTSNELNQQLEVVTRSQVDDHDPHAGRPSELKQQIWVGQRLVVGLQPAAGRLLFTYLIHPASD